MGRQARGDVTRMKAKVLIVDDEPDVLESTGLLIQALGYEVVSYGSLREPV